MPLVQWKDEYETGQAELDGDHRRLIDMVNTVYDAWASGRELGSLGTLFDQLVHYTNDHFRREEAMLEAEGYDRLDEQRAEHQRLREQAQAFRDQYLEGNDPAPFTSEVRAFLRSWLMGHILTEDMKYKPLFDQTDN